MLIHALEAVWLIAAMRQKALILEDHSAAYIKVPEQRTTEHQRYMTMAVI